MDDGDRAQQLAEAERARALAARALPKPAAESAETCLECGEQIPRARREAIAGVQLCIDCAAEQELADRMRAGR
jgi:phage/conjugal plasmid C-4 type zinc finger TraR family protein